MTDDEPAEEELPFEATIDSSYGSVGIGALDGELPEDYTRAKVDVQYLKNLVEAAELFGWGSVTLSMRDDWPVIIQNEQTDDKPTLAVAPKIDYDDENGRGSL